MRFIMLNTSGCAEVLYMEERFPGVYKENESFYTENLVPGSAVYGEPLLRSGGSEYRRWDYNRSKAAAALKKGVTRFPVARDGAVLYLGASTGTTVSHISDIVNEGIVYAVEYAPKVARGLVSLADTRENIAPILGDARKPAAYASLCSTVDVIYQDVAQKGQIRILKENADLFLRPAGHAMIAIKAQSISSTEPAETVFEQAKDQLREDFKILAGKKLAPFHTDHLYLVLKYSS